MIVDQESEIIEYDDSDLARFIIEGPSYYRPRGYKDIFRIFRPTVLLSCCRRLTLPTHFSPEKFFRHQKTVHHIMVMIKEDPAEFKRAFESVGGEAAFLYFVYRHSSKRFNPIAIWKHKPSIYHWMHCRLPEIIDMIEAGWVPPEKFYIRIQLNHPKRLTYDPYHINQLKAVLEKNGIETSDHFPSE